MAERARRRRCHPPTATRLAGVLVEVGAVGSWLIAGAGWLDAQNPASDNFDPGILIRLLYDDLVEVEALAITADDAVTSLPPSPTGKHKRTLARLFTLVGKTSSRACAALERGEELVSLHEAHEAA